jgi:hypothetical protein
MLIEQHPAMTGPIDLMFEGEHMRNRGVVRVTAVAGQRPLSA